MGLSCEWMDGYVFDVPYIADFFFYQTPDFLNFCLLLNGFEHPPLKNFKFLELGSGMGFNLNCMAALYPNGEFYGIDFNPEHICFSNKIKDDAGLKNVSFYELSFEEFLKERKDDFPKFDYIISHGVFSFVSDENKNFIVEIIKNKLKQGGVCYISYNDMCGCFFSVPIQRLLLDYSKLFPDLGSLAKINMGKNLIKKMKDAGCMYFNLPIMERLFKKFEIDRLNYLAHEYLNETWNPLFFTDVLSYMKGAKVKYVCQADPIWYFEDLFLTDKQLDFLKGRRSIVLKEIIKDYMVGMAFRKDLYIKGGQALAKGELIEKIKNIKVVLRSPIRQEKFKVTPPYGNKNINIDSELIKKLIEVLNDNSCTIGEMMALSGFQSMELSNILRVIAVLLHSRVIDVVLEAEGHNMESCVRLNKIVAKEARYKNLLQQFCIPKSKSGIFVDIIKRLVYDALVNEGLKDLDSIISYVIKYTNEHEGVNFTKGEIEEEISHCIEEDMVQWERLGIIDIKL